MTEKDLKVKKDIVYETAIPIPTRRDGGNFTADPPRITKEQMHIRRTAPPDYKEIKKYKVTDFNKMAQQKKIVSKRIAEKEKIA